MLESTAIDDVVDCSTEGKMVGTAASNSMGTEVDSSMAEVVEVI